MHLPDSLLDGPICPLTMALSATALVGGFLWTRRTSPHPTFPTLPLFASTTGLLVAAQMVNVPVLPEVSGHLLGGVLAARVLGVRFAILSMSLVVVFQALALGDGGVQVLGANLCNIVLVATGIGGLLDKFLRAHTRIHPLLSTGLASWASVFGAAVVLAGQLTLGGTLAASSILPALLGVHLLIGFGEGLLTTTLLQAGQWKTWARPALPWVVMALVFLGLSTVSSPLPDGLEWAIQHHTSADGD